MTRGTVRVHAKWMAKGLMTVEHTAAIEATLRLDETIGLTTEQRSRLAALLSAAGWRPPALVVSTVEELDALADGAVVLDVEGFVMLKQSGRWFLPGEEYEYHRSAADLPVTVLVEADQ